MTNGQQPEGNKGTFGTEWLDGHADRVRRVLQNEWPSGEFVRPARGGTHTAKGTYSYSQPQVNKFDTDLRKITDEVAAIVARKQNDYGPNNIRKSPFGPLIGLTVRLYDKIARLANLTRDGKKPENESLRDTFVDIAGYGLIGLMILDGTFPEE